MGSFSWTRADLTTKRSNLTFGDKYKILVPKEFGGGYINDVYFDYGYVFYLQNDAKFKDLWKPSINSKNDGYFVYVNADGWAKHFEETADLYGILAYWNGCKDMDYNFHSYPRTMHEILLFGKTTEPGNRSRGILLHYDWFEFPYNQIKYPLKLVSASYKGTYEDCKGISYTDPNQGFGKYKWSHRDYEKIYQRLQELEEHTEPQKVESTTPSISHFEQLRNWINSIDLNDENFEVVAKVISGDRSCRYCAYNHSQECLSANCSEGILKYLKSEVEADG